MIRRSVRQAPTSVAFEYGPRALRAHDAVRCRFSMQFVGGNATGSDLSVCATDVERADARADADDSTHL